MIQIFKAIRNIGIVPVIKINEKDNAVPLAHALISGGIPCAEITFRTKEAGDAIRNITKEFPEMLVGAGTVTTLEQLDEAISAGSKFIVSPGFNPKIVDCCMDNKIPVIPGIQTPSEIERAMEYGLKLLKFFPAEQSGGAAMIKALSAPYSDIKFLPTGGITEKNLNDYLSLDCVIACGSSYMADASLIDDGNFAEIERRCNAVINTMLGFNIKHLGINSDEEQAHAIASFLQTAFGFVYENNNSSILSQNCIEITKLKFPGEKGHIAFGTNDIERAVYQLGKRGIEFDSDSLKYDSKGNIAAVYLKNEIGGFAIHLIRN